MFKLSYKTVCVMTLCQSLCFITDSKEDRKKWLRVWTSWEILAILAFAFRRLWKLLGEFFLLSLSKNLKMQESTPWQRQSCILLSLSHDNGCLGWKKEFIWKIIIKTSMILPLCTGMMMQSLIMCLTSFKVGLKKKIDFPQSMHRADAAFFHGSQITNDLFYPHN